MQWLWCFLFGHEWTLRKVVTMDGKRKMSRYCIDCGKFKALVLE